VNPFDLRGPEFLIFYTITSAAVIGALAWFFLRRRKAAIERASVPLEDPLLIAYLRGGVNEAVAVAIASLVDRGLLKVEEDRLQAAASPSSAARPIERAILGVCAKPSRLRACVVDRAVRECCDAYRSDLDRLGLASDGKSLATDLVIASVAWLALLAIGVHKLDLAIARGHKNINGLILLMAVATIAIIVVTFRVREGAAVAVMKDLRVLFADLRRRGPKIERGRATNDLEYLAAVYGASMLPVNVFPERDDLFPHPATYLADPGLSRRSGARGHCGGWSSCGGGSGCGGGGGGGGCGGCGSS
jgi:uncharacterized protein (TIGR04222 family)